MNKEYKKAPEIFTNKDLDYLKDIFGWHHTAYKVMMDALNYIEDEKVNKVASDCAELFNDNMNFVLHILKDGKRNE